MKDRVTESWWSQMLATAIDGEHEGESLREFSLVWTRWARWRRQHPDTEVLSRDTGYVRDDDDGPSGSPVPVDGYYHPESAAIFQPLRNDDRAERQAGVIGAWTPDGTAAVGKDTLLREGLLRVEFGGEEVVAVADEREETEFVYATDGAGVSHDGEDVLATVRHIHPINSRDSACVPSTYCVSRGRVSTRACRSMHDVVAGTGAAVRRSLGRRDGRAGRGVPTRLPHRGRSPLGERGRRTVGTRHLGPAHAGARTMGAALVGADRQNCRGTGTLSVLAADRLVGLALGALVSLNGAVALVSYRAPVACGIERSVGILAAVPALLSGATYCAPALLFVVGVSASATLLVASLLLVGRSVWLRGNARGGD